MKAGVLTLGIAGLAAVAPWDASARGPAPEAGAAGPRVRVTLNEGWRFALEPPRGAEGPGHDDSAWRPVDLPHTWNAEDAVRGEGGYHRGVGWYRRWLSPGRALAGQRLFLHFEGANQAADVYVDGRHVGRHEGGYTAFAFEVTDRLTPEARHLIAVRVDNRHDPGIPPLEADFTFYGGIYRDVWLVATRPIHLEVLDHASPGVFIDTPEASAGRAEVRIRGTVVNDSRARRTVEVSHRILDASGREAAAAGQELDVAPGARIAFERGAELAEPELWSPERPYLYRVVTELRAAGRVLDRVDNPLGVRWFGLDAERGFLLNGAPRPLRGTNRHQDHAGLGNALPDELHRRDVRLIEATGFDFLRLAHYPQDPAVLEEADRAGLLVWEEIPVVNRVAPTERFAANAERMLVEMIRQHYNHPSIAMWGYMNEVFLRRPDPAPEGYDEFVVRLAERLDRRAREEDPGRLTALALSYHEIEADRGLADIPHVLGMNLYFGWYYGDDGDLGRFLDGQRARHPDRRLLVSEYGAGSDERVHAGEPRAFDFSSEYQQRFHAETWPRIAARPWLLGGAVWNQFDFGSAGRQDTKTAINQKGLHFFDRSPKDVAFYYRAMLREEPVLFITRERRRRAGSRVADRRQAVWAYSNLDEVELAVDGVSVGPRPVRNGRAEWTVELGGGAHRLTARGVRDGIELVDVAHITYDDRVPFFTAPASEVRTHAVNAGGHYAYVDGADLVWEADRPHGEAEPWGFLGGEPARTHHRILGTDEDALFQATREGVEEYRFAVPDGAYELWIGLVETVHDEPGARAFGVRVGDVPVFEELDLAGTFGRWVAVGRTARVEATGGRGLTVAFEPVRGRSTVSALRLVRR